jgi:hypothetical protein
LICRKKAQNAQRGLPQPKELNHGFPSEVVEYRPYGMAGIAIQKITRLTLISLDWA